MEAASASPALVKPASTLLEKPAPMREILIFGAAGQVGQALMTHARDHGFLPQGLVRPETDITDAASVAAAFKNTKAAVVVNAAAYTAVDKAENDEARAFAVNRDGPRLLAETCEGLGIPVIHISTDYVFDGSKPIAYTEEDPVAPLGVYGASKEAGERAIRQTFPQHIILRTAWVYSAVGHNFVKTMLRLGADRDQLRVVCDQKGSPTAADDIAGAILTIADRVLSKTSPPSWGTFHFSGTGATTWHGFANAIFAERARLTGHSPPRIDAISSAEFPTPAARPANSLLDCRKLAETYGVRSPRWEASLARVMEVLLMASKDTPR